MRARALFMIAVLMAAVLGTLGACAPQPAGRAVRGDSRFLYAWAGDADKRDSDFLAVIDADPRSPAYASVVQTLPAGAIGTRPHHTNHEMPGDGILWANGSTPDRPFASMREIQRMFV